MNEAKWVLVTGASTGIGRATTEYLAANGFYIYAGARKEKDLRDLAEIENVISVKLDVTKSEDVSAVVDLIKDRGTGLFALFNNAGIVRAGPLMDLSEKDFYEQFEVNLIGIHRVTKAMFPFLLESQGRIVMNSSDSGFFAAPFFGPYNASKFALEGYSDSLRRELLLYGVKVIIIEAGSIKTEIWRKGEELLDQFPDSMFIKEARAIGEYAIDKGMNRGIPAVEVAKVVHKALTKKKPKLRYVITADKLRIFMIKHFPASWVDRFIKKELEKLKAEDKSA